MKNKTKSTVSAASVAAVLLFANNVMADCQPGGGCKPKPGKPKTHLHVQTDWSYYADKSITESSK